MAEERIAIYETESKIIEGDYGDFYNTISHTEAIERMAKAMCEKDTDIEWEKNGVVYQHIYKDLAEDALDALIKGE